MTTDSKKEQKAIRELEAALNKAQIYHACFHQSYNATILLDKSRLIIDVNQEFTSLTGYTLEECKGKDLSIIKSDFYETSFYQKIWDHVEKSGKWTGDVINRRKDHEIFQCRFSVATIRNEAGEITHYICTFMRKSETPLEEEGF